MRKRVSPNHENEFDFKGLTQLKESEDQFRNTLEQAAVGIAYVGPNGNFILINQKFCDIVGYSKQEMCKLTFQDISYPDDLAPDLSNFQRLIGQDIDIYTMEKRYLQKNKKIVWVHLTISLVRNETGDPKYYISVVEDITERKLADDRFNC